jgi:formyltetrahydrofolate-dependent phosphoribosylglycinamide formyltransferase
MDRAEVLRALRCVDAVVVFAEPRATSLIETIRPHIYSKGGDYTEESLNPEERAALHAAGTEIRILPLVPGRSTTSTIQRMAGEADTRRLLKLAFLGSGQGTNFQAVIDAVATGKLEAEIVAAISDRADSGFLQRARAAAIPSHHVDPGRYANRFSAEAQQQVDQILTQSDAELVILAGFMRVIKEPVLSHFAGRIVNLHPSLLPKHKGAHAIRRALEAGDTDAGATIHHVTAELDGGDIIAQAKVPILPGDTESSLSQRIQAEEHVMLVKMIADWPRQSPGA